VSNLSDFNPAGDALPIASLEEVDRYILARYGDLATRVLRAYEEYDYGTIFQAINGFVTVDLSAFYADVSKDRLYTFAATSPERRSAQTAMHIMANGLARLLAPILSFTADELWRYLPAVTEPSVHLAQFPSVAELAQLRDTALLERWAKLTAVRERVMAEIEPLRKDKKIGSSLQARVVLTSSNGDSELLSAYAGQLPMLFIVSDVELERGRNGQQDTVVRIERAGGVKCERCWRYVPEISSAPHSAGLCSRCQSALGL
jgi:isoleucyl-tRNA synthetase